MSEIPYSDEWRKWHYGSTAIDYAPGEKNMSYAYSFPYYNLFTGNWIVFKPFSDSYMLVPGTHYDVECLLR